MCRVGPVSAEGLFSACWFQMSRMKDESFEICGVDACNNREGLNKKNIIINFKELVIFEWSGCA